MYAYTDNTRKYIHGTVLGTRLLTYENGIAFEVDILALLDILLDQKVRRAGLGCAENHLKPKRMPLAPR